MTRTRTGWSLIAGVGLVGAASLSFIGCGGVECGDSAFEQGGECVSEISCGPNTDLHDEQCVADEPVECEENTERAADTNECVASDEVCGENTVFSSEANACVPTGEVCGDGAHFDEETGLCYPAADCRPGDVVVDGECTASAEHLAAEVDVAADGNTDPQHDGEPAELGELEVGEQIVFSGIIDEPTDLDDDGVLNQHVDVFEFDADSGDWFEVSVYSLGIPNPAFSVGPAEYDAWVRNSAVGTGIDQTRQYVSPPFGTHQIAVFPESAIVRPDALVGGEDWAYVGTIQKIESPQPHDYDSDESATGSIGALSDNYLRFSNVDDETISFHWSRQPEHVNGSIQIWESPTELIGQVDAAGGTVDVPDSGDFYFVIDWIDQYGDGDLEYEIEFEKKSMLDSGEAVERIVEVDGDDTLVVGADYDSPMNSNIIVTVASKSGEIVESRWVNPSHSIEFDDLDSGIYNVGFEHVSEGTVADFTYWVEIATPVESEIVVSEQNEGDVLEVGHDHEMPHRLSVLDDEGEEIVSGTVRPDQPGLPIIGVESGEYTVEHFDFRSTDVELETKFVTPTEVTDFDATYAGSADEHIAGESGYFLVEFNEATPHRMVIEHTGGDGQARLNVYETGHRLLRDSPWTTGEAELPIEFLPGVSYVIQVGGDRFSSTRKYDYKLSFQDAAVQRHQFNVSDQRAGDVVNVGHTSDDAQTVSVTRDDTATKMEVDLVWSFDHGLPVVGLEPGDYTARLYHSGDGDIELETKFITPTEIVDFDVTYSGTASQRFTGQTDYYRVEVDEPVDYQIRVERMDGNGGNGFSLWRPGHRVEETAMTFESIIEREVEFEPDTPHILRIGGSRLISEEFDYELRFEEQ